MSLQWDIAIRVSLIEGEGTPPDVVHEGMGFVQGDRIVFGVAFERGQGGLGAFLGQHPSKIFIATRFALAGLSRSPRRVPRAIMLLRGARNTKRAPRGAGSELSTPMQAAGARWWARAGVRGSIAA